MIEDTGSATRPLGRQVRTEVFGDTAAELELAALDDARKFFGTDLQLEIAPGYTAFARGKDTPDATRNAAGKRYFAAVTVQTVEA
jgi:hypothetical protein